MEVLDLIALGKISEVLEMLREFENEPAYIAIKTLHEQGEDVYNDLLMFVKYQISHLQPQHETNGGEIGKAIDCLDINDIAGYFTILDKVELPTRLKTPYHKLRDEFIGGFEDADFVGRLRVFANGLQVV